MSACCVSACRNRHSAASGLKFYRIPSGHRPFQANRRRLWLRAIQQANGGDDELRGNVRVCGAHFISGEASMDHDSPDFVPSLFTRRELSGAKKKERKKSFVQRFYSRRRRRRHKVDVGKEETQSPTEADERSPVVMATEPEAQTTSSPSAPQGEEALRKGAETQSTSSPNKTPRSSAVFGLRPGRMNPVVLLTPLLLSAGGYRCELNGRTVTASPPPGEHRPLKEEEEEETPSRSCDVCGVQFSRADGFPQHRCASADEPSFSCNMCDRTFTTTHHLKRHKLLHVRDGRKCGKCGVLFCRRHNHVAFQPATAQQAQDSSSAEDEDEEPRGEDEGRTSEHGTSENPERSRPDVKEEDARETTPVFTPTTTTTTTLHYIHYIHTTTATDAAAAPQCPKPESLSKKHPIKHLTTVRLLPKPSSTWRPPTPEPRITIHPGAPSLDPPVRPSVLPPGTELPSSLKIFSPHYLTSPLFHVRRDFEYILSKLPRVVKEEPVEAPVEEPASAAGERRVADEVSNEKVAYDLEIVV